MYKEAPVALGNIYTLARFIIIHFHKDLSSHILSSLRPSFSSFFFLVFFGSLPPCLVHIPPFWTKKPRLQFDPCGILEYPGDSSLLIGINYCQVCFHNLLIVFDKSRIPRPSNTFEASIYCQSLTDRLDTATLIGLFDTQKSSSGTKESALSIISAIIANMLYTTFTAACGLAAVANAHMFLATPVRLTSPSATNGPITSANFPCQAQSGTTFSGTSTDMELGSDQPLAFEGQSVHGGGSCQISITYDESPTSESTWKVITSIEGGCVARDTAGNLGSDTSATAADPYTYNFTIPDNIPTGNVVLAWTWFNKVGNREMYMQCASVKLTGTSGDQSNYDSLPDMFTANLDDDEDSCHTQNDSDVEFPDPGDVVQKLNGATDAFKPPTPTTGTACGATAGASSAATTTAAASGGSAATSTAAAGTTYAAGGGGVFATAGGSAPTTSTSEAAAAATTGSDSSSSGSSSSSSSSSSSGTEQTGSCSDDGSYVCLSGGSTYQVCASGEWSVAMDVASGTECSGSGSDFAIAAASTKTRFRRSRQERRAFKKRGLGTMFGRA